MIDTTFITAGKATFTIEPGEAFVASAKCKPWYTYRVQLREGNDKYPDTFFVSLLTGPDNTADYAYVGILDPRTGSARLTAKSTLFAQSTPVKVLQRVLAALWQGRGAQVEAAGWRVRHDGKCGRCRRTLTVPASLESGIGPECAKSMAMAA